MNMIIICLRMMAYAGAKIGKEVALSPNLKVAAIGKRVSSGRVRVAFGCCRPLCFVFALVYYVAFSFGLPSSL